MIWPIGADRLFTVHFVEPQVIIAEDAFDREYMLRKLYKKHNKWGFTINAAKTEIWSQEKVIIYKLEQTLSRLLNTYFIYLGVKITSKSQTLGQVDFGFQK